MHAQKKEDPLERFFSSSELRMIFRNLLIGEEERAFFAMKFLSLRTLKWSKKWLHSIKRGSFSI